MNKGENSDSIPIDLILEILSRLPAKSIKKFQCVSKLWRSLLCKPYFTELFLTRSSSRPRLLIGVKQDSEWFLFSSPQPQNPSSPVVSADSHMKIGRYVLTLGTEKLSWRLIQCPFIPYNEFIGNGICINGVLYYLSYNGDYWLSCFDVRSEKVKLVGASTLGYIHWQTKLINFKGKLGLVNTWHTYCGGFPLDLRMWVLEDIDKQKISAYDYTLRTDNGIVFKDGDYISVVGATASGEIVLVKNKATEPFYVFYFNPERNILRSVVIQSVRQKGKEWSTHHQEVHVFVDHVEDLNFDVMKAIDAATSISRPAQQHQQQQHL
ncbi:F-box protein At1g31080-like [Capsella rubella]|uniref:F-box protein At1g31080-like n=1 Tax=Capsella rubella TaxID=81985 RepID=UPI000CD59892|nr:F-box protein At1g31080-like [Capsella rubella]